MSFMKDNSLPGEVPIVATFALLYKWLPMLILMPILSVGAAYFLTAKIPSIYKGLAYVTVKDMDEQVLPSIASNCNVEIKAQLSNIRIATNSNKRADVWKGLNCALYAIESKVLLSEEQLEQAEARKKSVLREIETAKKMADLLVSVDALAAGNPNADVYLPKVKGLLVTLKAKAESNIIALQKPFPRKPLKPTAWNISIEPPQWKKYSALAFIGMIFFVLFLIFAIDAVRQLKFEFSTEKDLKKASFFRKIWNR